MMYATGSRIVGPRRSSPIRPVVERRAVGTVIGWDADLERWIVEFDHGGGLQRLAEGELEPLQEQRDLWR